MRNYEKLEKNLGENAENRGKIELVSVDISWGKLGEILGKVFNSGRSSWGNWGKFFDFCLRQKKKKYFFSSFGQK